jgi:hypothetical protein
MRDQLWFLKDGITQRRKDAKQEHGKREVGHRNSDGNQGKKILGKKITNSTESENSMD